MKRRLSALLMLLVLASCDTTNANNLMLVPGPWVTAGKPGHYEIVVRDFWGVSRVKPGDHSEIQLKTLRLAANTAKDKGADRFFVLRVKHEVVSRRSGWSLNFPVVRMDIRLLREGEEPPEGKAALLTDETIRMVNEKLNQKPNEPASTSPTS